MTDSVSNLHNGKETISCSLELFNNISSTKQISCTWSTPPAPNVKCKIQFWGIFTWACVGCKTWLSIFTHSCSNWSEFSLSSRQGEGTATFHHDQWHTGHLHAHNCEIKSPLNSQETTPPPQRGTNDLHHEMKCQAIPSACVKTVIMLNWTTHPDKHKLWVGARWQQPPSNFQGASDTVKLAVMFSRGNPEMLI